jgi:hypothetical protein
MKTFVRGAEKREKKKILSAPAANFVMRSLQVMNSRNIPYAEITPRQKEFLFHFVRYIAELLTRKKEDYDFPDFERFYCTNDKFKQAMLDCNVKFKKDKGDINWSFRGGYQNDKAP